MKVMQFRYVGPTVPYGPGQGFLLTVQVASSTNRPTTQEIKTALIAVGFPSYVASNSTLNCPTYWK